MKKTIHVSFGLLLVAQIWMPANVLAHETDASAARHNKPLSWQGPENLGEVSFESSCKVSGAIDLVNNGLKLLHSFEYEFSRENFRRAQELEPNCAIAYWGEAMSDLMIVHFIMNYDAAENAYARMDSQSSLADVNSKERALIDATRALLTMGDRTVSGIDSESSLQYFRSAMTEAYDSSPDDPDIASLYSLAVLGTRFGVNDYSANLVAGQALERLVPSFPRHPGVLHLILHSYENRWQSWRSRIPAETYDVYTSGTIHSLHMPSHYYYYRGDWNEIVRINQHSWAQALHQQEVLGLGDFMREYHGRTWAIYAWLQMGDFDAAYTAIEEMLDSDQSGTRDYYLSHAIADYILQTPPETPHRQELLDLALDVSAVNAENQTAYLFVHAWEAFRTGDPEKANKIIAQVERSVSLDGQAHTVIDEVEVMKAQLKDLSLYYGGELERALAGLRETARKEDVSYVEHGIPLIIKPTHEILGDLLMEMNRYGEAMRYYRLTSLNHRGRRWAAEGVANAAKAIGDAEELEHARMRLATIRGY